MKRSRRNHQKKVEVDKNQSLYLRSNPDKNKTREKYCLYNENKRKVQCFGHKDYDQYIVHQDDKRKQQFKARHDSNIQKFKKDPFAKITLANELLWNKKSLNASVQEFNNKHGVKIINKTRKK